MHKDAERKIGDGIATSGEEGTATAGVIQLRLLCDVDPELGDGVRPTLPPAHSHSRLSQISTPPLSSSFFNIPFLLFTSTPSNNHKKTQSRCLPSCMSFPPIFRRSRCFSRSILLPAVSLGRLPGQFISSGCGLERTMLTWLCSLQCRRWSYWFGRHGTLFQLAVPHEHSGNYQQDMLLIMMPTSLYLVVISMRCCITRL